jgi:hypothetical protein
MATALENFQDDIEMLGEIALRMMSLGVLTANRDAEIASDNCHSEIVNIGNASGELFDGGKSILLARNYLDVSAVTEALQALTEEFEPHFYTAEDLDGLDDDLEPEEDEEGGCQFNIKDDACETCKLYACSANGYRRAELEEDDEEDDTPVSCSIDEEADTVPLSSFICGSGGCTCGPTNPNQETIRAMFEADNIAKISASVAQDYRDQNREYRVKEIQL